MANGDDENFPFGAPGGVSYTPYNWGQGLGDVMKLIAGVNRYQYGQKKQKITDMLTEARAGGMEGLRQLYADPEFQSMNKELGIKLPPLPPPSPDELKSGRFRSFYSKLAAREAEVKSGKGGAELTPGERMKIRQELAPEFFDISSDVGLPSLELSKGVVNTLVRSIASGNTDPILIMKAWEAAWKGQGINPESLPVEDRIQFGEIELSPMIKARIEELRAKAENTYATAALKDAKTKQIYDTFELEMQKLQAEVDNLIASGNYKAAMTRFTEVRAEWEPKLKAADIALKESQTVANYARTDLYKANTGLAVARTSAQKAREARDAALQGPKVAKLQVDTQIKYVDQLRKWISNLQTSYENEDKKEARATIKEEIDMVSNLLREELSELDRMQQGLSTQPGAIKPPGEVKPPQNGEVKPSIYNFQYQHSSELFDFITSKVPVDLWMQAFNQARTPESWAKNPTEMDRVRKAPPGVWAELQKALLAEYKKRTGKPWVATRGR
jgi:hypothetical protein